MKKVSVILAALLLVAVSVVSAFAAGINDSEQKVLDELKTSVKMQGTDMYWPDSYVNQAENLRSSRTARLSSRLQALRTSLTALSLRSRL